MLGFLFRLFVVVAVIGAVAVLFEFRFAGNELRVRSRFGTPWAAAPAAVEPPGVRPARSREEIPEHSRRQIEQIIEEKSK
jgi:hypothetical protein